MVILMINNMKCVDIDEKALVYYVMCYIYGEFSSQSQDFIYKALLFLFPVFGETYS